MLYVRETKAKDVPSDYRAGDKADGTSDKLKDRLAELNVAAANQREIQNREQRPQSSVAARSMTNLFAQIPASLPEEITETLVQAKNVWIERIVTCGQASPEGFWFDQDQNEWVAVIQGAARLQFEDEVVEMNSGDWVNITAHRKHRVAWMTPDEPTIWLAVFYECDARLASTP